MASMKGATRAQAADPKETLPSVRWGGTTLVRGRGCTLLGGGTAGTGSVECGSSGGDAGGDAKGKNTRRMNSSSNWSPGPPPASPAASVAASPTASLFFLLFESTVKRRTTAGAVTEVPTLKALADASSRSDIGQPDGMPGVEGVEGNEEASPSRSQLPSESGLFEPAVHSAGGEPLRREAGWLGGQRGG